VSQKNYTTIIFAITTSNVSTESILVLWNDLHMNKLKLCRPQLNHVWHRFLPHVTFGYIWRYHQIIYVLTSAQHKC